MPFNYAETKIVKGMLARGDSQQDISAYFGTPGIEVSDVAAGNCDYPDAPPMDPEFLPPRAPYTSPHHVGRAYELLRQVLKEHAIAPETRDMLEQARRFIRF